MDPHARYEDEEWEDVDLARTEAEAVELLDMQLHRVELTGSKLPRWSVKGTRLSECNLANLEAPRSEWIAVELHGCRLTGMDLRDSTGRHVLFADCRADLISLRALRALRPDGGGAAWGAPAGCRVRPLQDGGSARCGGAARGADALG